MKQRTRLSPVLLELVLVILFFALSSTVVLQLVTAAAAASRLSEQKSEAMIAATALMEQVKADPLTAPASASAATRGGEILLNASAAGTDTGAGTLYAIRVEATMGSTTLLTLESSQYVPGEAAE